VVVVLGIVASVLGVNRFLTDNGLNLTTLLGFALVMGFGGAFISLLISKPMAKWTTGAQVISSPQSADEKWLVDTVSRLAQKAGIAMPEVAIYEGEPNAFATGAFKNSSLVAVSTGLLEGMTREEIEAVLAHEVAHIANGDMVTLTLIQGVLNTFVIFLSRVVGYAVDSFLRRNDEESSGPGIAYYVTSIVLDIVFGIVASIIVAWFSRQREFRADDGAADLMGRKQPMINAHTAHDAKSRHALGQCTRLHGRQTVQGIDHGLLAPHQIGSAIVSTEFTLAAEPGNDDAGDDAKHDVEHDAGHVVGDAGTAGLLVVAAQKAVDGIAHHTAEEDHKGVEHALDQSQGDHVAVGNVCHLMGQHRFNLLAGHALKQPRGDRHQ